MAKDLTPIWSAEWTGGRLFIHDVQGFMDYARSMQGHLLELVIKKKRKTKPGSDAQQGYYFKVIVSIVSDHTGYDMDSTHEELKVLHAPFDIVNGKKRRLGYSQMNSAQREEYHARCRRWGAEFHGLNIPMPNEVQYE